MEGSMGCLRKKVGRAGCFPSPLHETLKTCDSNQLTRQGKAAVGSASGTPHPPEKGEPIRETPHEFKGLVGMAWPRSGVERSSNVHSSRNRVAVSTSALFPAAARRGCRLSRGVPTKFAHGRQPPLQPDAADECAKLSQASYLKESDTRVRNAATLPSSTFMSICVTSATRRSRSEPAAVSTALRPASSHDLSLTPTTSTIL